MLCSESLSKEAVFRIRIRGFKNLDPDPSMDNLQDLNDGFDKVLEKPDQKRQC